MIYLLLNFLMYVFLVYTTEKFYRLPSMILFSHRRSITVGAALYLHRYPLMAH